MFFLHILGLQQVVVEQKNISKASKARTLIDLFALKVRELVYSRLLVNPVHI